MMNKSSVFSGNNWSIHFRISLALRLWAGKISLNDLQT